VKEGEEKGAGKLPRFSPRQSTASFSKHNPRSGLLGYGVPRFGQDCSLMESSLS
jgi:hypothetical protein